MTSVEDAKHSRYLWTSKTDENVNQIKKPCPQKQLNHIFKAVSLK